MELPSGSQKAPKSEAELSQTITGNPNAEYVTISHLSDDIVQLVRGSGGQVSYLSFYAVYIDFFMILKKDFYRLLNNIKTLYGWCSQKTLHNVIMKLQQQFFM